MALSHYSFTALINADSSGQNIVAAQAVSVNIKGGGLATIYSDDAGASPITQPGAVTDTNGVFEFYVASGTYTITSGSRTEEVSVRGSELGFENVTKAEMEGWANPEIGKAYIVSDRANGIFDTVAVGTTANVDLPNGLNIIVSTTDATKCFVLRNDGTASAKQFGLVLDGVADDTNAFIAWANATTNPVEDSGTARITSEVLIESPWIYKPGNQFIVFPDFNASQHRAVAFETDDVDVEFKLDGTGATFTGSTGNKYGVYSGQLSGATKYKNHRIKVYFDNWQYSDGNTGASNLIVAHAYYANNVDNIDLEGSEMHNTSGAAYFVRNCTTFNGHRVKASNNVWYPFNLESGVDGFLISLCDMDQTGNANGVYWGGGINLQSQQDGGGVRNKNGIVMMNEIKGNFSYGSVIRVNSCENVVIKDNNLNGIEVGAVASAADLTGIRVDTRGISTAAQNGACENITVQSNRIKAGTKGANTMQAIYCSNQWQSARAPLKGLFIENNEILSPSSTESWDNAIICHGFDGGIEDLHIKGNYGQTLMNASPIVDGAIGLVANNAQGEVKGVHLGSNRFTDIGTPTASYQLGLGIGGYVDEVFNDSINTFDNYWYGVRTFTNAGPTLDKIDDNSYLNIGSANELYSVNPSRFGLTLTATTTYDPPSLTSGAFAFTDVTVTGAAIGDRVEATFSLNQDGVIFTGYVRVANSCRIYLENKDASTKDIGSGDLTVKVYR